MVWGQVGSQETEPSQSPRRAGSLQPPRCGAQHLPSQRVVRTAGAELWGAPGHAHNPPQPPCLPAFFFQKGVEWKAGKPWWHDQPSEVSTGSPVPWVTLSPRQTGTAGHPWSQSLPLGVGPGSQFCSTVVADVHEDSAMAVSCASHSLIKLCSHLMQWAR